MSHTIRTHLAVWLGQSIWIAPSVADGRSTMARSRRTRRNVLLVAVVLPRVPRRSSGLIGDRSPMSSGLRSTSQYVRSWPFARVDRSSVGRASRYSSHLPCGLLFATWSGQSIISRITGARHGPSL
uniref:Putative secreted protein n=1 Tax=Anopheles marajoara TaxID=58244 RepID=A0A2M4C7C0_9DIPT